MKRILYLFVIALSLPLFYACDDFMDVHKDFIEGGEIVYSPKADSVEFVAGDGRIMFLCWLYNSPNVKSVDLYWNEYKDSLITLVSPSAGRDSVEIMLNNMREQAYTFYVYTTDIYGHKSLRVDGYGSAYGSSYTSTLNDRRIRNASISEGSSGLEGSISFFSAPEMLVRTEIRYTKGDGTTAIAELPASSNSISCPDAKPGTSFETRSLYIPETAAIDTFATVWTMSSLTFPTSYQYDRSGWTVLSVSDQTESDGGGMTTIIDGDLGTYWHSNYTDENTPVPHWAIIDMATAKNAVKFNIYRRAGNTDAKTVQFYLGDTSDTDGDWTKVAEGEFSSADNVEVTASDKTTKGRYLKIMLTDSNRDPFTSIAEVYVFGGE